jgi:uncharacterized protein with FMN-binding domain
VANVVHVLRRLILLTVFLSGVTGGVFFAEDGIVLSSGASLSGKVRLLPQQKISVDVQSGNRTLTRSYPLDRVKSYTLNGQTFDAATGQIIDAAGGGQQKSAAELQALIRTAGSEPPEWLEDLQPRFPDGLDFSWPQPPGGPWDSSKNIGQFVWDRVNPNPSRWREGVALMHEVMRRNPDPQIQQRAMRTLGGMYHNLHQDYARAAWWFLQSGLDPRGSDFPQAVVSLADCYLQLGGKSVALEIVRNMPARPYSAIKLLGDAGETDEAVRLGEQFAKTGQASTSLLYAGDACRVAGRLEQAEEFYRRARQAAIDASDADKPHRQRDRRRAEASIAVVQHLQLSPDQVADGTYRAASPGYEADVEVEVILQGGKMQSVRVTQHREKQFYSSIAETPARILRKQSVNGIDATTGATITSEAIINATAKAMLQGAK